MRQVKEEMKQQRREMREISRSGKSSEFQVKSTKKHRSSGGSISVKTQEINSSVAEDIDEYETDFENSSELRTESQEEETRSRTESR